jgi:di/tricarboxylate transporter
MTPDIIIVLVILGAAVVLLVTEWLPMEVVALLAMGAVAVSGLVGPTDALSGFSNPAVVTVWAVFILSGGLTRTGVANIIGRLVLRISGRREASIIAVIMVSAGLMSAFMNNVAVAALMLPVIMDIARQTGNPASRLLMPLAYGSLLGGLTTKIGTPPNLLVSEVLRENGLNGFSLFDFTPMGLVVMAVGVLFMVLAGRHLLPRRNIADDHRIEAADHIAASYNLRERLFHLRVPSSAAIVGHSLAESRLGILFGLNVIGVQHRDQTILAPSPGEVLQAEDRLTVEGSARQIAQLKHFIQSWTRLHFEPADHVAELIVSADLKVAELAVQDQTPLVGTTLKSAAFRNRFGLNVLAIKRGSSVIRTHLQNTPLKVGDTLLLQGRGEDMTRLSLMKGFQAVSECTREQLMDIYRLDERLRIVRVPQGSVLDGLSLRASRIGVALGIRVLCITRQGVQNAMPGPDDRLAHGDTLLLEGRAEALDVLRNLSQLRVEDEAEVDLQAIQGREGGLVEAILHPHSNLGGQTLAELRFREKYGLNVLAIWRRGRAYREHFLGEMELAVGDAMLLYGPREKFKLLGREPDFVVLTESVQAAPRQEKAALSVAIMLLTLLPAVLNWIPIYIATPVGAAGMVIFGCLTVEEAYRAIEWKGIVLIAGMIPLGTALDSSGAAALIAGQVVAWVGPFGPLAVLGGLIALTFLATCIIPTSALVVLLGPIVLKTAADLSVSPHAMMMAIAMTASSSFMTPISHPANLMVMGPGGYRFTDYFKAGLPLTLVIFAVLMAVLPWLWPFRS